MICVRKCVFVIDFTMQGMSLFERMKTGIKYLRRWGMPPRGGHKLSCENLVRLVEGSGFAVEGVELIKAGSNALYLKGRKVEK